MSLDAISNLIIGQFPGIPAGSKIWVQKDGVGEEIDDEMTGTYDIVRVDNPAGGQASGALWQWVVG
eukprot:m.258146 g.258146  ORF g.258146 m.258146 type:complete len:66 (-) comp15965_c0_seq2:1668-1865(-)